MKLYIILGVCLIIIGVVSGVKDAMKEEFKRGYAAGADSLSEKHVSEVCIQWLFQSNLEQAKRKVCGK